jgi:hypothetical protein
MNESEFKAYLPLITLGTRLLRLPLFNPQIRL